MAIDISIFPGDPNRGPEHDGFMFTLRMEDGNYHKSKRAWSTIGSAALSAGIEAEKIRKAAACQT